MESGLCDATLLQVKNVNKSFTLHNIDGRNIHVSHDINFVINAGEHVALAGTSVAGKSTLLRILFQTYSSTSGTILFKLSSGDWVDLTQLSDSEIVALRGREIGYVSQFLRAQPRRSVIDLVTRSGIARGMNNDSARELAQLTLDKLHIAQSLWEVHTSVLSGGEKQRVNIAAGLISPPRLLLLDEPISALDPENRALALELIQELSQSGVAVLAVFHDLDAIEQVSDRIIAMEHGRIVQEGPTKTLLPLLRKGYIDA